MLIITLEQKDGWKLSMGFLSALMSLKFLEKNVLAIRGASGGLELCRFTYKIANYSDMSADGYTHW